MKRNQIREANLREASDDFSTPYHSLTKKWVLTDLIEDEKKQSSCDLCGQAHLRFICVITYPEKNIDLHIGNVCINEFDTNIKDSFTNFKKEKIKERKKKLAGYRACITCKGYIIPTTEPKWKKECLDCYYQVRPYTGIQTSLLTPILNI